MKQVSTFISIYTADVSAVCSALYELGGMVVIHDPSGCNSTYNTHDEPRWYDKDSLVFISGLSEIDAIMGNDEKLIRDIVTAAGQYRPKFIVLLQSPVPLLMGTDFLAIAKQVEDETGISTYFIPTTGMHSYIWGAGEAFLLLAKEFVKPIKRERRHDKIRVNLLGLTPLDFSVNTTIDSLRAEIEKQGMEIKSAWAMGSDLSEIQSAVEADLNIVVTSCGFKAAVELEKRFGIPYIVGLPVGEFAPYYWKEARNCVKHQKSAYPYKQVSGQIEKDYIWIGEPVIGQSIAASFVLSGKKAPVVVTTIEEVPKELIGLGCRVISSEEELKTALAGMKKVTADPLFLPVCPEDVLFDPLPEEACSGRIYRKQIPDLIQKFNHE